MFANIREWRLDAVRQNANQTVKSASHRWLGTLLVAIFVAPAALVAQEDVAVAEPAADAPTDVQVSLKGYTFAPALDEEGLPVLDEDGEPVILRVPLAESIITPGDQVLYAITLDNPTEAPAMDLSLGAVVAGELLLDPFSFTGPDGLEIAWADEETPAEFRPMFEEIDGEVVMTADLDALRILRLALPDLAPTEHYSVEYTVTLR